MPFRVPAPSAARQRLHRALSLPSSSVKRVKCSHTADRGGILRRRRFRPWPMSSPSAMIDQPNADQTNCQVFSLHDEIYAAVVMYMVDRNWAKTEL